MKLAILLSVALALPTVAGAEVLHPPGGPVAVDHAAPSPARRGKLKRLRRLLVQELDANGDGKLGPRERRRAARVLRRLAQRLGGGGPVQRRQRLRRFIQRHDRNHDGSVGPQEMPRGAANRLRCLDCDGDGWIEPREVGPRRPRR